MVQAHTPAQGNTQKNKLSKDQRKKLKKASFNSPPSNSSDQTSHESVSLTTDDKENTDKNTFKNLVSKDMQPIVDIITKHPRLDRQEKVEILENCMKILKTVTNHECKTETCNIQHHINKGLNDIITILQDKDSYEPGNIINNDAKCADNSKQDQTNNRHTQKLETIISANEQCEIEIENTKHVDSTVNAEKSKKLRPMVILKGISNEIKSEHLIEIICKQNSNINKLIKNNEDIVLKFKKNNRNPELYNAILIVTPLLWKYFTDIQRINIDYQKVHVEEHIPLMQCYNCMKYGHTRKWCKAAKLICSHCASSDHLYKNCPHKMETNKTKCYNCTTNINSVIDHSATSNKCPLMAEKLNEVRSRIDYDLQINE